MRAAYILMGGPKWPDRDKLARTPDGPVDRIFYEARDPQIDLAFFTELRKYFPGGVGIGYDPTWTGYTYSPEKYAADILARRKSLGGGPVLFDGERHDPVWILRFLTEFRRLAPGVNITWTLESYQAGWFTDELVAFINDYPQLRVCPQLYKGDMTPLDGGVAARDLAEIYPPRLCSFYGLRDEKGVAVRIPSWWDGILYLEGWDQLQ